MFPNWIFLLFFLAGKYVGTKAIATGWGTLKEDGKPSCILQEVEVPILDNSVCVENTNYTQKMITDNMMCAGYPGVGQKDSCQVCFPYDRKRIDSTFLYFILCIFFKLKRNRVIPAVRLSQNVRLINYMNWSESFHGVTY